jgi:two-component system nitrate/nitrite response regulator NarL
MPVDATSPPGTLRILLADDHRITLWGLQQLIESAHPRMCVAGAVTTRHELLAHPALAQADVVLLDLDLAGSNAVDAMGELTRLSSARVLVLTAEEDPAVLRNVVLKGARGVLHKSAPAETLLRAIEKVAAGGFWLDATLLDELLGQAGGPGPAPQPHDPGATAIASLTPREREIVLAMVRKPSAKQLALADDLGMSEHTLRNHLTTIYDKLGVRGHMELYVFATEHGLGGPAGKPAPP